MIKDFTEEQGEYFETLKEDAQKFGYKCGLENTNPKNTPKMDDFLKTNHYNFSPEQLKYINEEINEIYNSYREAGKLEGEKKGIVKKDTKDSLKTDIANLYEKQPIIDIPWAIENWMESTGLCLIGGATSVGKSTLAIKIAVQNAMGRVFWLGGGLGDGRKSLYICLERKKDRAFNKEIACGGDGNQIDILESITINGKEVLVDLENEKHLNIILQLVRKNNYFSVIFDPIADLVLSKQNDNAKVRKAFNIIFKQTENMNTLLIGIIHLKKERSGVDELGMFRGASEFTNIANSVLRVTELKDNEGLLFYRLKVNEAKDNIRKGAIKLKIEECEIPKKFLAPGSKEKTKGGIKSLNFEDKPLSLLKKDCVSDTPDQKTESNFNKVGKIIEKMKVEGKELNTKTIKDLAKIEGVSGYYFKEKNNWKDYGYEEHSIGQGSSFRIVLRRIF